MKSLLIVGLAAMLLTQYTQVNAEDFDWEDKFNKIYQGTSRISDSDLFSHSTTETSNSLSEAKQDYEICASETNENCTSAAHDVWTHLYRKCHCSTFSYPKVTAAISPLGIKTTPKWVICSDVDQDGTEWCVCGVYLSWETQPENKQECLEKREKVKQIIDSGRFQDVAFSYPLICL